MKLNHLELRAELYRLLAATFYPPDQFFDSRNEYFEQIQKSAAEIYPQLASLGEDLKSIAIATELEPLQVEYARLFVGPFHVEAPPYGSVYLEENGRLMGESTIAVRKFYQKYGLELDEDFSELPDHIAAELEFVYYLLYNQTREEEENRLNEAGNFRTGVILFLEHFLAPFVQDFTEKIKQHSEEPFYTSLAEFLKQFVQAEVMFERKKQAERVTESERNN
ncbi:MAG: molecular chaperone TorD family protein [Calditrichia bacterium]